MVRRTTDSVRSVQVRKRMQVATCDQKVRRIIRRPQILRLRKTALRRVLRQSRRTNSSQRTHTSRLRRRGGRVLRRSRVEKDDRELKIVKMCRGRVASLDVAGHTFLYGGFFARMIHPAVLTGKHLA